MENTVSTAIAHVTQAKNKLAHVFSNTPDDRVAWSPSATARTPIQIVAHSAFSLGFISKMLDGTPYPAPTMAEADANFLAMEAEITTREAAMELLEDRFQRYMSVLEKIGPDDLEKQVTLPFGMGAMPLGAIVGIGAVHTWNHIGQLEYVQTIYGDRTW